MRFKQFLYESTNYMKNDDLKDSLDKIPAEHKKLLKGYSYKSEGGNTLTGDDEHIGMNDLKRKKITISAPWSYGREFALLHEIGHLVWAHYIANNKDKKEKWSKLVSGTKHKVKQNMEELFCHTYANTYANNKIEKHTHKDWESFIKSL